MAPAAETPKPNPMDKYDWKAALGTSSPAKATERYELYKRVAEFRMRNDLRTLKKTLSDVRKDPALASLKTKDELAKDSTRIDTVIKMNPKEAPGKRGWYLGSLLNEYFKQMGVTDPIMREKEVGLSLHCLTLQKDADNKPLNVDLYGVRVGAQIKIEGGKLTLIDHKGVTKIDGAELRYDGAAPKLAKTPAKQRPPSAPRAPSPTPVPSKAPTAPPGIPSATTAPTPGLGTLPPGVTVSPPAPLPPPPQPRPGVSKPTRIE